NNRYAEIYELPPELLRPGTPHGDIITYRLAHGMQPARRGEACPARHQALIAERIKDVVTVDLKDGRTISITHHPMSDGGWVSTHEDITKQRQNDARIRHLARHDPLTELPTRMLFREQMEQAEARIQRGEQMAVL